MDNDYRQEILSLMRSEFIGPCPEENPVENGEEVIEFDSPLARYTIGILYPKEAKDEEEVYLEEVTPEGEEPEQSEDREIEDEGEAEQKAGLDDDPVNLSNAYHQSAVSLTVKLGETNEDTTVVISFGTYHHTKADKSDKKINRFPREQHAFEKLFATCDLPSAAVRTEECSIYSNDKHDLVLCITNRETADSRTKGMYTFSLINRAELKKNVSECEFCLFQVEMLIRGSRPLQHLQDSKRSHSNDEDYQNNQLLYRNIKTYGIGHGCAASWNQYDEKVFEVRTSFIPSYEVRPVIPEVEGFSFDMHDMSDAGRRVETLALLSQLCDAYSEWITSESQQLTALDLEYQDAAKRNITSCKACLKRIENGIAILANNEVAFTAFCLANKAMLLQQLHYKLPLAKWRGGDDGRFEGLRTLPSLEDRSQWPAKTGTWRAFQIAFLVMNIQSIIDKSSVERTLVDLIWFPTGGGKTEAYLGLTAFLLFYRRLVNANDVGVTVLMRYTLRLLTTQQFERASSLVCACEIIREEMPSRLGKERYSIGLWVGGDTSPNSQERAIKAFNKLKEKKTKDNPFILLKCPCCGAQMGPTEKGLLKGYSTRRKSPRSRAKEFHYQCSNSSCHFSAEMDRDLPIYCIDEDIYTKRPSLVIGTVDKFASLPIDHRTRNLFGRGEVKAPPPDLIIQDELHLISGPLGSMVGFYETAIAELCRDTDGNGPKIIGSTATISHAKEQCAALYGLEPEKVCQFPPSCLNSHDSFFAVEEKDLNKPGRIYVGICAPGSSMAMSVINTFATLYMAPALAKGRVATQVLDGYWTNLGYFNSLRELGRASTWVAGNIIENLKAMRTRRRKKNPQFEGRTTNYINHVELTSLIPSGEIPGTIKKLECALTDEGDSDASKPCDICLSTNMISVGVDISRLALMTVDGQPKTTSEYIQATSRVGRDNNPGLVFTVYSPTKARDKSHYEDFQRYHAKLYCNVEPTSITPFSAPLRDRAAKALLVTLVRQLCDYPDCNDPAKASDRDFARAMRIIMDRVGIVDEDETDSTYAQFEELVKKWKDMEPQAYTSKYTEQIQPLIMRQDSKVNLSWMKGRMWEAPSSMRNVDAGCVVKGINGEYLGGE